MEAYMHVAPNALFLIGFHLLGSTSFLRLSYYVNPP